MHDRKVSRTTILFRFVKRQFWHSVGGRRIKILLVYPPLGIVKTSSFVINHILD